MTTTVVGKCFMFHVSSTETDTDVLSTGAAMLAALVVATDSLPVVRGKGKRNASGDGMEEEEEEEELEMIGIHKKTYENVTETGQWIVSKRSRNVVET